MWTVKFTHYGMSKYLYIANELSTYIIHAPWPWPVVCLKHKYMHISVKIKWPRFLMFYWWVGMQNTWSVIKYVEVGIHFCSFLLIQISENVRKDTDQRSTKFQQFFYPHGRDASGNLWNFVHTASICNEWYNSSSYSPVFRGECFQEGPNGFSSFLIYIVRKTLWNKYVVKFNIKGNKRVHLFLLSKY